jgi:hypothetical protein
VNSSKHQTCLCKCQPTSTMQWRVCSFSVIFSDELYVPADETFVASCILEHQNALRRKGSRGSAIPKLRVISSARGAKADAGERGSRPLKRRVDRPNTWKRKIPYVSKWSVLIPCLVSPLVGRIAMFVDASISRKLSPNRFRHSACMRPNLVVMTQLRFNGYHS